MGGCAVALKEPETAVRSLSHSLLSPQPALSLSNSMARALSLTLFSTAACRSTEARRATARLDAAAGGAGQLQHHFFYFLIDF